MGLLDFYDYMYVLISAALVWFTWPGGQILSLPLRKNTSSAGSSCMESSHCLYPRSCIFCKHCSIGRWVCWDPRMRLNQSSTTRDPGWWNKMRVDHKYLPAVKSGNVGQAGNWNASMGGLVKKQEREKNPKSIRIVWRKLDDWIWSLHKGQIPSQSPAKCIYLISLA